MRKVRFTNNRKFKGHEEGFFHQWVGYTPEEGDGNATAMIEFIDGTMEQISYEHIVFVYPVSNK